MEGDSTNREYTQDELLDAGAHSDFVDHYMTAYDGRHSVVAELDGGFGGTIFDDPDRAFDPSIGGGFFESLWTGGFDKAWAVADGDNRKIMEKAGYTIPA